MGVSIGDSLYFTTSQNLNLTFLFIEKQISINFSWKNNFFSFLFCHLFFSLLGILNSNLIILSHLFFFFSDKTSAFNFILHRGFFFVVSPSFYLFFLSTHRTRLLHPLTFFPLYPFHVLTSYRFVFISQDLQRDSNK